MLAAGSDVAETCGERSSRRYAVLMWRELNLPAWPMKTRWGRIRFRRRNENGCASTELCLQLTGIYQQPETETLSMSSVLLPPEPWRSFLRSLNNDLKCCARLDYIGHFLFTQLYGLDRMTADMDVIELALGHSTVLQSRTDSPNSDLACTCSGC